MRIGVVELDTSHPQNWIPIERKLGHEVVGVWDEGAIRPKAFVEEFARDLGVPKVFRSLEEMIPEIDCAIFHSCNWDIHVERARPFVEAGIPILIDKPIAGKVRDLEQLREWVRNGARICGGSSLRFCRESRDWSARPVEERGTPITVVSGCGTDEFNYGIHAYALLSSVMGPGIQSVQHLCGEEQRRIAVTWSDGRMGILVIGTNGVWLPFHATIVTEKSVTQYQVDSSKIYESLLRAVLPYLAGETDTPPVPFDALIEPELCAIAALRSKKQSGQVVLLSELPDDDEGYDGATFAAEYRKIRNPKGE